jgi:Icc-related predicted phosphoesterase
VKVLHTSDVHGRYEHLLTLVAADNYDVWVDTGDTLPNPGWTVGSFNQMPETQRTKQASWWHHKDLTRRLLDALNGRPHVSVMGNHDFMRYASFMRQHADNVYGLHSGYVDPVEVAGLTWYGISEIPYMNGRWNFETQQRGLEVLVSAIPKCDVLLSHAPPAGVLSYRDEWGIPKLETAPFRYLFCGHVHECGGMESLAMGKFVYNSATTHQIVEAE